MVLNDVRNQSHSDIKAGQMPPKDFKCKQCGNCCLNLLDAFSTSATDQDFQMWEDENFRIETRDLDYNRIIQKHLQRLARARAYLNDNQ